MSQSSQTTIVTSPIQKCLPIRHPQFYFEDGTIIIEVSDKDQTVLYKLHRSFLALRSLVLKDALSLPQQVSTSTTTIFEGFDDYNPFNLSVFTMNKITPRKFQNLCIYLFCGPSELPNTEEFLIDILDISKFLQIEDGVSYVIKEFDSGRPIHPALRMNLARSYRIDQWISAAFHDLVRIPLLNLDLFRVNQMGIESYYCLVSVHMKLERFRKSIAAVSPPAVHAMGCTMHQHCQRAWEKEWWNGLARYILHPELCPTAIDTTQELQTLGNVPGMCGPCFRETLDAVFSRDIFRKEHAIIEEGIEQVTALIT